MVAALGASIQGVNAQTQLEPLVVEGAHTGNIQLNSSTSSTLMAGDFLEDVNIDSLAELERMVPGLKLSNQGTARFVVNSLRGLGDITRQDYFNSSIAVLVDGVYIPTAELDLSLLNIESVEVLRGPQTAGFGRNAIAGAINITTKSLADTQGTEFSAGIGNKDNKEATISTTGTLAPGLLGHLTLRSDHYNGFIHNLDDGRTLDDRENLNLKTRLDWALSDRWNSRFDFNYIDKSVGNGGNQHYANYTQYVTDLTGGNREDFDIKNYDLHLNYSGDEIDFRSQTSYHDYEVLLFMDLGYTQSPGAPAGGFYPKGTLTSSTEEGKILSQTFELSSKTDPQATHEWMVGFTYERDESFYEYLLSTFFEVEDDYTREDYSIYAKSMWHLNPLWSLTTAARYTEEDHSSTGTAYAIDGSTGATMVMPVQGEIKQKLFSPRVELAYKPEPHSTYFGSLAQGVRGGGLNRFGMLQSFDKETVTTAEIGMKKFLPAQQLSISSTLFYNDWDDMQIKQFFNGGSSNMITNAGKANSYGIELEGNWQASEYLNLFMNGLVLRTKLDDYASGSNSGADLSGNKIPNMPEQSLTLGATWRAPLSNGGQWMLSGDYAWKGTHYFDPDNRLKDSYGLLNIQTGLEYKDWQLYFWTKNLLDKDHLLHAYKDDFGIDVATPGRGREFGLRLKAQF